MARTIPSHSETEKSIKKMHRKFYKQVHEADADNRESRRSQFIDNMTKELDNHKEERKAKERNMTETVYSRWYRPPEIILLDHNYN